MADQKEMPVVSGDMKTKIDRASILIEALPYIRKLRGQTIVIKYGGNAMVNEELKQSVMDDITLLKYIGINPIIVHGGGPDISSMLKEVNVESHFVNGLRYTDDKTMGIAQMVLIGKTNKEIVSALNLKGAKAVGICGIDGNLIEADEELQRLMTCAARELEHDIWEFLIIRDGDDLFAYVKLNVNWSDPCDLYRYDPQNDTLIHLCRWQNKDFSGIRVLEGAK